MSKMTTVAAYLVDHAEELGNELMDYGLSKLDIEIPEELIKKSRTVHVAFFKFLSEAIQYESEQDVADGFIKWSKQYSEKQATMYDQLSKLIQPYPENRLYYNTLMTRISMDHQLSAEETVMINNRLNYMLDISLTDSILAYERYKNDITQRNKEEIMELSAPIVPLQNDIAVLPLIGSIDHERAEHLMTKVVPHISSLGIECLIMDFSGIVTIDSEVASHVFNITNVLGLLGIKVIITGLRPDLAQRVVLSGINFSALKTFSNVKQAMDSWTTTY